MTDGLLKGLESRASVMEMFLGKDWHMIAGYVSRVAGLKMSDVVRLRPFTLGQVGVVMFRAGRFCRCRLRLRLKEGQWGGWKG